MLLIRDFTVRPAVLDFRSAGLDFRDVEQIFFGDERFANAVELTCWQDPERFQVEVCSSCGIEQCELGNWLCARRAGHLSMWLPVFAELGRDRRESPFWPPTLVNQHGAIAFERDTYDRLRAACRGLPEADALPVLRGEELVRIVQWSAPVGFLGKFPEPPRVSRTVFLTSSDDGVDGACERLEAAIAEAAGWPGVDLRAQSEDERRVSYYLDGPQTSCWSGLSMDAHGVSRLMLGELVAERNS
jgi:hypothetical protein